ncbi:MAG: hypothetical protein KDA89_16910 [Planctomycetaceae bacterium]|nr:hypothetical protein [Planctomycetaceae bacterium]
MKTLLRLVLAAAVVGSVVSTTYHAEAQSKKSSSKATPKEDARYRRLPTYFGQLEIDEKQREEIYSIRAEFGPKIEELQKQIQELREEMDKECEDVLTSAQKTALNKLRDASEKSSGKSSSSKSSGSRSRKSSSSKE